MNLWPGWTRSSSHLSQTICNPYTTLGACLSYDLLENRNLKCFSEALKGWRNTLNFICLEEYPG